MLVLGAKIGERIFVNDVPVVIVRVTDGTVRLGFDAPQDVRIERQKVRNRRLKIGEHFPGKES